MHLGRRRFVRLGSNRWRSNLVYPDRLSDILQYLVAQFENRKVDLPPGMAEYRLRDTNLSGRG